MHPNHKLILIPAEDNVARMQAYVQTKLIQQTLQRPLRPDTQTGRRRTTGQPDKVDPEGNVPPIKTLTNGTQEVFTLRSIKKWLP